MRPVIVVHGGAGAWQVSEARLDRAVRDCKAAACAGQALLLAGGSALDAAELAVRMLENSPVLDAGRGSYLNAAGFIEMDAIIMDGSTLELGAVAAVQRILNPISLARQVMDHSAHNFLVCSGAEHFAESIAFPRCEIADLIVDGQLEEHEAWVKNLKSGDMNLIKLSERGNTVGAVAFDLKGNLAAATSTGGTHRKQPGRVGDSPLVGSGAYADNWSAGASATGHGESLMKVLISKRVCDFTTSGLPAQQACEAAIDLLHHRVQGEGGVIAIDNRGNVGVARNTSKMPYCYGIGDGSLVAST